MPTTASRSTTGRSATSIARNETTARVVHCARQASRQHSITDRTGRRRRGNERPQEVQNIEQTAGNADDQGFIDCTAIRYCSGNAEKFRQERAVGNVRLEWRAPSRNKDLILFGDDPSVESDFVDRCRETHPSRRSHRPGRSRAPRPPPEIVDLTRLHPSKQMLARHPWRECALLATPNVACNGIESMPPSRICPVSRHTVTGVSLDRYQSPFRSRVHFRYDRRHADAVRYRTPYSSPSLPIAMNVRRTSSQSSSDHQVSGNSSTRDTISNRAVSPKSLTIRSSAPIALRISSASRTSASTAPPNGRSSGTATQ